MFKIGSVNKKFNKETETFRYSFHLTHKGDPIFLKSFDGADPDKVLLGSNTIVLKNHFFTTGEELYYFADGSSIGIDHTSSGVGAATTLPEKVYAIKVDENKIKLAATPALAKAGTNITKPRVHRLRALSIYHLKMVPNQCPGNTLISLSK